MGTDLLVLGEALADMIDQGDHRTFVAYPSGGPLNVAVAAARLGLGVGYATRFSGDPIGRRLRAYAAGHGLDLSRSVAAAEHSGLAIMSINDAGDAVYDFRLDGTADYQWTPAELAPVRAAPPPVVHVGSIASWYPPGGDVLLDTVRQLGTVVSYDPNIRAQLLPDPAAARDKVEQWVRVATLAKASVVDVGWLYPGWPVEEVAGHWRALGARIAVVTLGGDGAYAMAGDHSTRVAAPAVRVADTVGAGDAFAAALCVRLSAHGVPGLVADLDATLRYAACVAGLACERAGPSFPTAAEVDARLTA
jgi:fructokinase